MDEAGGGLGRAASERHLAMSADVSAPASTAATGDGGGRTLGLPQATSLVVGTIIGVGIVTVPASLASHGSAVREPFVHALGAFLLGVPVYLLNRRRMTPPPGPPPPVDALGGAATVVTAPTAG
jgi:hypothetical protein